MVQQIIGRMTHLGYRPSKEKIEQLTRQEQAMIAKELRKASHPCYPKTHHHPWFLLLETDE